MADRPTRPGTDTGELTIITKLYDLLIWTARHVEKFPRTYRFSLGEALLRRQRGLLDLLLRAKYTRQRTELLTEANLQLELLRFDFRQTRDLRCLNLTSFGHAAACVNEIGQMLGGWRRRSPKEDIHAPSREPVGDAD
jgi:hypothetical protein